MRDIGMKIREIRMEKGMSQEELAHLVGYKSKSSINKIELTRDVRINKIVPIANALGVDPRVIMGWDEEAPVPNVENVEQHVELIRLFDLLSAEQQEAIIHMMHTMAGC